jgi:putative transcriptional regulator
VLGCSAGSPSAPSWDGDEQPPQVTSRGGAAGPKGALADQLGVSRQTVNALETGRYDPALPLAFRIARLFAQPFESILMPDEEDALL